MLKELNKMTMNYEPTINSISFNYSTQLDHVESKLSQHY